MKRLGLLTVLFLALVSVAQAEVLVYAGRNKVIEMGDGEMSRATDKLYLVKNVGSDEAILLVYGGKGREKWQDTYFLEAGTEEVDFLHHDGTAEVSFARLNVGENAKGKPKFADSYLVKVPYDDDGHFIAIFMVTGKQAKVRNILSKANRKYKVHAARALKGGGFFVGEGDFELYRATMNMSLRLNTGKTRRMNRTRKGQAWKAIAVLKRDLEAKGFDPDE